MATAAATPTRTRVYPANTCGCVSRRPGLVCVRITDAKCVTEMYMTREMPGQEPGVRGFSLRKWENGLLSTEYHVHLVEDSEYPDACTCKGYSFSRDRKPCKHIRAIRALDLRGDLF